MKGNIHFNLSPFVALLELTKQQAELQGKIQEAKKLIAMAKKATYNQEDSRHVSFKIYGWDASGSKNKNKKMKIKTKT